MRMLIINHTGKVARVSEAELLKELANGTHFQEYLKADYKELIAVFGKPNAETDSYKVDAEWQILTPDGIATIYNYKDGKNYLGNKGLSLEEITDWHIGGHNESVVRWIETAVINARNK